MSKFKKIIKELFRRKQFKNIVVFENSSLRESIDNTIMLYKKNGKFVWAKFKCPCDCGKDIVLSLNPNIKPYWTVHLKTVNGKQYVTFQPSVWLEGFNCKSHFFIRDNKIIWV